MRDEKIINLHRILYPDEYATKYIFTYPTFNDELKALMEKSGYVDDFKTKYYKSLRFLENLKRNCIHHEKLFELLKNAEGIYSIKLHGKKNIRILFDFHNVDNEEIVILYNCFEERRKKDYAAGIEIAQERRKK